MSKDVQPIAMGPTATSIDALSASIRFLKAVRARKRTLIIVLMLSGILGGVFYVRADRVYQSKAQLLVLEEGGHSAGDERSKSQQSVNRYMPTYEAVLSGDLVIKSALNSLPPEFLADYMGVDETKWVAAFRNRLSVSSIRRTNVIDVAYQSQDPEIAKEVVDALLASYVDYMNDLHQSQARSDLAQLSREKEQLVLDLNSKEVELLALKSQSKVVFGSDSNQTNVLSEAVIALSRKLQEAHSTALEDQTFYRAIQNAVAKGEDIQQYAAKMSELVGNQMMLKTAGLDTNSYATGRMEESLLADQSELQQKMQTLGPNHPDIIELTERITTKTEHMQSRAKFSREMLEKNSTEQLAPQLVEMARQRYELSASRWVELKNQYERTREQALAANGQLAEIKMLEREVERQRTQYETLMGQIKQVQLTEGNGLVTSVMSPPQINRTPISPKLRLVVVVCFVLGTGLGLAIIYVMDVVDDRFHSPDDLRSQVGAPILAMVRKMQPLEDEGLQSLYTFVKPNSIESEAFRSLRTALDFSGDGASKLTISSTEPSDGKTTLFANLSVAYAQAGKKTLVIDGDMRRPGFTKLLNLNGQPGLSTALRETRPMDEVLPGLIHKTELDNLDVISAGPRPVNPVELLTSHRLSELIAWAETQYDQLLIDAPPSLAVADVQIIGRMVDGAVLVVRPDKNRRKLVLRAAEALTALGCPLLGIVVNHVQPGSNDEYSYSYGYGDTYGHGYGHGDDHEEFGATDEAYRRAA